ncbi:flavin-containing monooxygenase [Antrihabitans cavernicola]|uniref:FAD-containing monooxygenase EthA n=1 Tax=Antrihabitans cavernicola TaxID=2495913 RepID=A0A5A7SD69_9NOCA|nr:NAD(P)/FAD-dependent oxidoreductase [Spelaeibacter cavernicola]KAA0024100.1 NAD(P)/FAD-dependent oxidoreductase [Spelaeibacter cavernicola]
MTTTDFDILIIGAGISGIGTACHLKREKTGKTYAILERRNAIGGTWDLFRYPGIRSDSDMYTFGYHFRPWHGTKILADGTSIREYIKATADEYGVTENIRFGRKVVRADWSSADGIWTVEAFDETTGNSETYTSKFLVGATGYYNYDEGFRPTFPGEDDFAGDIVHPQHWPEDLDYTGKRVVVIGSGATAITLVPAMAGDAASVTMLQRSPTYILPLPAEDPVAGNLKRLRLPQSAIYKAGRARNIALQRGLFELSRNAPAVARKFILSMVRAQVGPDIDMKHFTPSYNPWDERLCVVPRADLFKALRKGTASIVTDHIEKFTETGIDLKSGEHLDADIIVAATGLQLQIAGGMQMTVDGNPVDTREHVIYKGVLLDGVPNAMFVLGYTNASWTLKADIAAEYFCRLLSHMDKAGYTQVVATADSHDRSKESVMGDALKSGYIKRGDAVLPRQGTRKPFMVLNDYYRDAPQLRHGKIDDDALHFSTGVAAARV